MCRVGWVDKGQLWDYPVIWLLAERCPFRPDIRGGNHGIGKYKLDEVAPLVRDPPALTRPLYKLLGFA